jgi:hypothetical protein
MPLWVRKERGRGGGEREEGGGRGGGEEVMVIGITLLMHSEINLHIRIYSS